MEVTDFLILSDDYQKLAILGADRSLELHTSQGLDDRRENQS